MNEISAKFKRQIELLGIAIKNTESLGINELAQMYGVESLTIKRDLRELRNHGIDVHSEGKIGVRLSKRLDASRTQRLLSTYLALSTVGNSVDKASDFLTKKLGTEALNIAVILNRCIENTTNVIIGYQSERAEKDIDFVVSPMQLFRAHGLWRLLAEHDGIVKQFLLTKIVAATPTANRFRPLSQERIEDLFRYSFAGWTGTEEHRVRLRLSKECVKRLRGRQGLLFDDIREQAGGSFVAEGTVNSLEELASWIVGQGEGTVALRPGALIRRVEKLARIALRHHSP